MTRKRVAKNQTFAVTEPYKLYRGRSLNPCVLFILVTAARATTIGWAALAVWATDALVSAPFLLDDIRHSTTDYQ